MIFLHVQREDAIASMARNNLASRPLGVPAVPSNSATSSAGDTPPHSAKPRQPHLALPPVPKNKSASLESVNISKEDSRVSELLHVPFILTTAVSEVL